MNNNQRNKMIKIGGVDYPVELVIKLSFILLTVFFSVFLLYVNCKIKSYNAVLVFIPMLLNSAWTQYLLLEDSYRKYN